MKNIHLIALRLVRLFGSLLICVFCLLGCLESTQSTHSGTGINTTLEPSEVEFQRHSNRPPTAKTLYAMANILSAQGRDAEFEFITKRIIQQYPQFIPAYNSLAELQMRQGRISEAIDTISRGLRIHPKDPVLLNNLGMCWLANRNYEKALDMFTKAAGLMAGNARYRANMAVALGLMGRYEESLFLFRQILPEDQADNNLIVLREAAKKANIASLVEKPS